MTLISTPWQDSADATPHGPLRQQDPDSITRMVLSMAGLSWHDSHLSWSTLWQDSDGMTLVVHGTLIASLSWSSLWQDSRGPLYGRTPTSCQGFQPDRHAGRPPERRLYGRTLMAYFILLGDFLSHVVEYFTGGTRCASRQSSLCLSLSVCLSVHLAVSLSLSLPLCCGTLSVCVSVVLSLSLSLCPRYAPLPLARVWIGSAQTQRVDVRVISSRP